MIRLKLKKQLEKLGKNASEVSVDTKINRNTINSLVNGKVEGIRFSTLDKICLTYGLDLTDLIDFERPLEIARRELYKQEVEMVPFSIWLGMIALSQMNISLGGRTQDFGRMDGYFRKNYTVAYWDLAAMNSFAKIFYSLYSKPEKIDAYYAEFQVVASEIENLYDSLWGEQLSELSELSFSDILQATKRSYITFWLKSFFIETFDAGFDQEEITRISGKYGFSKKEIEILTTPVELTLDMKQKSAFLTILAKALNKKNPPQYLKRHLVEDIEVYKRQYDFTRSNYAEVYHLENTEIFQEAERLFKNKDLIKTELKRLERYGEIHGAEIRKVLKKYHLKKNPLYFFNVLTAFREHRKTVNMKGFHVSDFILTYLELKTGIPKKYLKFLSFDEIDNALKGLVSNKTLQNRYEDGILVSITRGKVKTVEGKEARSIIDDLEEQYLNKSTNALIKGFTASQGYAKGVARLILTDKDFEKFRPGDILVTSMVRAEYVPLVEKSAAVVAGEGGISSYSAVVSRSFGKPCIIGVGNATSVIQDGDLLEVRASHGTVRILKK